MLIETLAQTLEDAGIGTQGTDLFAHYAPDIPISIMLRLPLTGAPLNHELPGYRKHALQVVVRGIEIQEIQERCDAAVAALVCAETQVGDIWVNYIRQREEPIFYPRSPGNGQEASINFDCCYVREGVN